MDNDRATAEIHRIINELDKKVDVLMQESERVTALLADDPRYGRRGLLTKFEDIKEEQARLRRLLEGYEAREQQRERQAKETAEKLAQTVQDRADEVRHDGLVREQKRDRFFVWIFGLLGTIIAGLIVTGVGVYLTVVLGGGS